MTPIDPSTWPATALDTFAAGFYTFVALYHLQLLRRRPEMRTYLWFALVCFGALGVNLTGIVARFISFPPSWLIIINLAFAGGTVAALLQFLEVLLQFRVRIIPILQGVLLGTLLLAAGFNRDPVLVANLVVMCLALFTGVAMVLWAASRGDPEARTIRLGLVVFGALLGFSVLGRLHVVPHVQGLPIAAFAALILSMAVSLSNRFERIHRELDALTRELERRVEERTRALDGANRRLRRYFPHATVARILSSDQDARPSTERRTVTVLFADLSGFTAYSDGLDPQHVTHRLNEFLSAMVEEIEGHGGTLDKVMGDGLMALWGAPGEMEAPEQARSAVAAATAMHERLARLVATWSVVFRVRIGINQDIVAVGNIGTPDLWSYTAIGDGVNLASRLEGACKPGRTLISEAVWRHLENRQTWIGPESLCLKGVHEPVPTWTLEAGQDLPPQPASPAS